MLHSHPQGGGVLSGITQAKTLYANRTRSLCAEEHSSWVGSLKPMKPFLR